MQATNPCPKIPGAPTAKASVVIIHSIHFMMHFMEMLFPSLLLFMARDTNLQGNGGALTSDAQLGVVVTAGFPLFLLYGIAALPWGMAADRFPAMQVIGIGAILSGIGAGITAYASSLSEFTLGLAIMGVGMAGYHPSGISLLSQWPQSPSRMLATNGIWGSAGMMMAPVLAGAIAAAMGWRMVFKIAGLIVCALGLAAIPLQACLPEAPAGNRQREPGPDDGQPLWGGLVAVGVVLILLGISYRTLITGLPELLQRHCQDIVQCIERISVTYAVAQTDTSSGFGAAALLSLMLPVGLLGQWLGGMVASRFDLRLGYLAFFGACIPAFALMACLEGIPLILATCVPLALINGSQPIENTLIARMTPLRMRSRMFATKFTVVFGIGAVAMLLVAEILAACAGIRTVFLACTGIQVLAVGGQLLLIHLTRRQAERFCNTKPQTALPRNLPANTIRFFDNAQEAP